MHIIFLLRCTRTRVHVEQCFPVSTSGSNAVRKDNTRRLGRGFQARFPTQPPVSIRGAISRTTFEKSGSQVGSTYSSGLLVDGEDCRIVVHPNENGRVAGICVTPTTATKEDDKANKPTVPWTVDDFWFRCCFIFRVDILSMCKTVECRQPRARSSLMLH